MVLLRKLKTFVILSFLFLTGCRAILTPPPAAAPPAARSQTPRPTPTFAPGSFLTPIPATPTFTPVPTATPVIHVVAQNDTLFGIALEYGVSLDAILLANGITADSILSIGQNIIIPMGTEEETTSGGLVAPVENIILPTPTPLPLTIGNASLYETPAGGLWCLGEVRNTTQGPITNLHVQIVLVAADGTPLLAQTTLAAADYLEPDKRAPFAVLFDKPPQGVDRAQTALLRAETISDITDSFVPLDATGVAGTISGPQYKVSGLLVNHTGFNVSRIAVVVTLYNSDEHVIGYRQKVEEETVLAAEQSMPFQILLTPQGLDAPATFQVIAWAVIQ
ncbi:MAG: LysM peptidoglycan-binding domain-containing protein [Anaerolineae bacterium]|nr:LysM peptidoglycan-binding domain-containing protein [Anaerolineae bacterium]